MALSQGIHLRRYHAKIFGDDRQVAEGILHSIENRVARTGFPGANAGRFRLRVHGPVSFEAAEVVDTYEINEFDRCSQPVNPPAITGLFVVFPGVQGVTPELAVFTEVVRRHTGNVAGPAFLVEPQDFAVGPGIGAVERNVDRHITEQEHAVFAGALPQCLPLVVEHALYDFY